MDLEQYSIPKFNLNEIQNGSVCVFIGKRKTGKSFCLRELLYHHKSIPVGTCISGSEGLNKFFSKLMPERFIHRKVTAELIWKALNRQEKIINYIDEEQDVNKKNKIDPRAFLILDDCLFDKKWLRHELIREVFMNGRHFQLLVLLTMQYPLGIGPELRTNVDYAFIFREPSLSIRKKIYDSYASIIPTFQLFNKIMDKCTENFECLVIKNMSTSNRFEDAVFWYKAEEKDNFKIGDNIFWDEQEKRKSKKQDTSYNNYDEHVSMIDEKKKKGINLNIVKHH